MEGIRKTRKQKQDFAQIRDSLLQQEDDYSVKVCFKDPEFLAEDTNIYYSQEVDNIKWKRPPEIVENPTFVSKGATRFDVVQGELGDCWLLAAIANLTLNQQLFCMVVPEDNTFEEEDYCGIFHFRFWQYGKWVEVVIDDRLPTRDGKLIFMHSEDTNEFWSALMEKAYAKLNGSYEALRRGRSSEALVDMSGGIVELHRLEKESEDCQNLYSKIEKAFARSSFVTCALDSYGVTSSNLEDRKTAEGLVLGHAYSITDATTVETLGGSIVNLLRVRNPLGANVEWRGAWSDGSQDWNTLPDELKEQLQLTEENDGEFWIEESDFIESFSSMEICYMSAHDLKDESRECWQMELFEGHWTRYITAGGCFDSDNKRYAYNPQYFINLESPDEDDEDGNCTIVVALMQKHRRALKVYGKENLRIGFSIYKLEQDLDEVDSRKPLEPSAFNQITLVEDTGYEKYREVTLRATLSPGAYLVVPSTQNENEEAEFILRVFTEKTVDMWEGDEQPGNLDRSFELEESGMSDETIEELFINIAGEDEEIEWRQLQTILDAMMQQGGVHEFCGFSRDVCKSLIALMDFDMSGKMGFNEYLKLFKIVNIWAQVFINCDCDNSGKLSCFELREALRRSGFTINRKMLVALVLRYGDDEGQMSLDDFIMCAIKLLRMLEVFEKKASEQNEDGDGDSVTFKLVEWVQTTLYS